MFKIVLNESEFFPLTLGDGECLQLTLRSDENFGLTANGGGECFHLFLRGDESFGLTAEGLMQDISAEGATCTLLFATEPARGISILRVAGSETLMELDGLPATGQLNVLGDGRAELELVTSAGVASGKLYGAGSANMELTSGASNNGSSLMADRTSNQYAYVFSTSQASTALAVPSYVGDDIDKTINELGDITMSEFCRKEVVA